MVKNPLPVFTRDRRTGSMRELLPGEPTGLAPASARPGPGHFRVLVVESDETDRLLTIWHLGRAWPVEREITVECAADGLDALEKIHHQHYGLVVLDWHLPHQDGVMVWRTMHERGLRIPIVVVSRQRSENIARDFAAMAISFVCKDEMDPRTFRHAITASMQLRGGPCSISPVSPPARSNSFLYQIRTRFLSAGLWPLER